MKRQILLLVMSAIGLWASIQSMSILLAIPTEIIKTTDALLHWQLPEKFTGLPVDLSVPMDNSALRSESTEILTDQAQQITVKVLAGEDSGSGILIGRTEQTYTVLTNDHVLLGSRDFQIQTWDAQVYSASRYETVDFEGNDLALLQFSSDLDYAVATLQNAETLAVGDAVFAAGFPAEFAEADGFKITAGQVSLMSDRSLAGGYQVGYTNAIQKGMSGGPVLNTSGEVIAVNGIHAYPLWGDPYIFTDGSHPCEPLRQLMLESSWAIPVGTVLRLVPASILVGDAVDQQLPRLEPSPFPAFNLDTLISWSQTEQLRRRAAASQHCISLNTVLPDSD